MLSVSETSREWQSMGELCLQVIFSMIKGSSADSKLRDPSLTLRMTFKWCYASLLDRQDDGRQLTTNNPDAAVGTFGQQPTTLLFINQLHNY
jgi:hypothetical protein